jgi:hypothetical protein
MLIHPSTISIIVNNAHPPPPKPHSHCSNHPLKYLQLTPQYLNHALPKQQPESQQQSKQHYPQTRLTLTLHPQTHANNQQ